MAEKGLLDFLFPLNLSWLEAEIKPETLMSKKLTRSRDRKIIGGVCAGIAGYLGWDPLKVRILYVLISILSAAFPGILVYIILWILMPEEKGYIR